MTGGQEVVLVGVNHRTAPVEIRERLAMPADRLLESLDSLRSTGGLDEAVILSTCNRVEIYAVAPRETGSRDIVSWLAGTHGLSTRELKRHSISLSGEQAVAHLFRVASSLDSMVVGEPQILGQLKTAFLAALEGRSVGQPLQRLMHGAIRVAKRVRTETRIGHEAVSVGRAGTELARQVFGSLVGRTAMLLGAGDVARLVARSMLGHGLQELVVVNRTYSRAAELAAQFDGTAVHMDQMLHYLEKVDVVITSTAAEGHIITRRDLSRIMRIRRYRPLFCIDLSVPRNIDPEANRVEGCFVFNVDDLTEVARQGLEKRLEEAAAAEAIVVEEASRCYHGLEALKAEPIIAAMTRGAELARQQELARSAAMLSGLDPAQRATVDAMTRSMFKRFLHHPIGAVRRVAGSGDEAALALLEQVFAPEDRTGDDT
jgi:glutamyl-tRNA reductase